MTDIEMTTISVRTATRERIARLGTKAQTYDDILTEVMDYLDKADYIYNRLHDEAARL
jgi:hypothetical protein